MKLKGKTQIELTDVKTGETEVIQEENMITNAINRLFSDNLEGMLFNIEGTGGLAWKNYHVPICPNAIGGILLYSDSLEENADNLYAPSSNPCVGYASNDANNTEDSFRGSMNLLETGPTDNGYKLVWDFATSQGNGTISAIALTHRLGGKCYIGNVFDANSHLLQMKSYYTRMESAEYVQYYVDMVEIDFNNNYFVSISADSNKQIIIHKVKKFFSKLNLTGSLQETCEGLYETQIIQPKEFLSGSYSYAYLNFMDGEDGYWYGFSSTGNSSGDAKVQWIKIKKEDYSFTEGAWTLENAQIYPIGNRSGYLSSPSRSTYSTLRNGYLYLMHYSQAGVYKVNIHNAADITFIEFGFQIRHSSLGNYSGVYMLKLNDRIYGYNYVINSDDSVIQIKDFYALSQTQTPVFTNGIYGLSFGFYSHYGLNIYKNLWILTPYLASVNNLETSVIKTADKTMKITYTLTEIE